MARPLDSEDVFGDWCVETILRYLRENDMEHVDEWEVERLLERVERPPVAFVFAGDDEQDPPVPYWSAKDVAEDCAIHQEDGWEPVVTLALRPDQMCEFLAALLNSEI